MPRLIAVVVLVGLCFVSCGHRSDVAMVEGKVIGADGRPPVLAHVHLLGLGDDLHAAIKSAKTADDGSFSIAVPRDRYYEIAFTAVDHHSVRAPLAMDLGNGIKGLEVTLAANRFADSLAEVGIFGSWNDFDSDEAEQMTRLGDGTFAFEHKVEGDTLAYQLLNATTDGRAVNGTDADRYRYDGGGDYISVVVADGGIAKVVFDPRKAVAPVSPSLPALKVPSKGKPIAGMFEINRRAELDLEREGAALGKYWQEHGTPDGFTYDTSDFKRYLMSTMSSRASLPARKYAAVKLASMFDRGWSLNQSEMTAVAKLIPPAEPVWADNAWSLAEVFKRTEGKDEAAALFERDLDKVVDKRVKGVMLLEIGLRARAEGDTAKQRVIYEDLNTNYADANLSPWVQLRVASELDPNLAVSTGKPLPDFDIALIDGPGTISKQDLQGKYWLIDLWATWCAPCVIEMPNLHKVYDQFGGPNFDILSISFDRTPDDVKEFRASKWPMPWANAYAEGMFNSDIAKTFEVTAIPKPILVDPTGKIVEAGWDLRGETLFAVLSEYVGK